jgi:hypothetical protein
MFGFVWRAHSRTWLEVEAPRRRTTNQYLKADAASTSRFPMSWL